MNTVCKEHEWVGYFEHPTERNSFIGIHCKNCGVHPSTNLQSNKVALSGEINAKDCVLNDFYIKENLSVINKQEWEDIFAEFQKFNNENDDSSLGLYSQFYQWVVDQYLAPEKK